MNRFIERDRRRGRNVRWVAALVCTLFVAVAHTADAQTVTQSFTLQPGWNSIYLEVTPEPNDTATLFASLPQVASVWSWFPQLDPRDYILDPNEEMFNEDRWLKFFSAAGPDSVLTNLFALSANRAYLIRVTGSEPVPWVVAGRPSVREIDWRTDSFNLTGFPLLPGGEPTFGSFLAAEPAFTAARTFRLESNGIWDAVSDSEPMRSGTAYWVFSNGASDYDAPLEVESVISDGLDFMTALDSLELLLRNRTPAPQSASIVEMGSVGGDALAYQRFDSVEGFVWEPLATLGTIDLAPGESRPIRIGVRRGVLTSSIETVLSVEDGAGTRWRVPLSVQVATASATATSGGGAVVSASSGTPACESTPLPCGLWVGAVTVNAVSQVNPPSADLAFDLELTGRGRACFGGDNEGAPCPLGNECTGGGACQDTAPARLVKAGSVCRAEDQRRMQGEDAQAGEGIGCVAWRYHDEGQELPSTPPLSGTDWRAPNFDDSPDSGSPPGWKEGRSPFGFGDLGGSADVIDEDSMVASACVADPSSPPIGGLARCTNDSAERPPVYYFRTRFTADPAFLTGLDLNLRVDDGAVVYLNGQEIARRNVSTDGFAPTIDPAVDGSEESAFSALPVDVGALGALVGGANANVLAVEVHQHSSEASHPNPVGQATPTIFGGGLGGSEASLRVIMHVDADGTPRFLKEVIQLWRNGTFTSPDAEGNRAVAEPGSYVLVTDDTLIPSFVGVTLRDGEQVGLRFSTVAFDFPGESIEMVPGIGAGGGDSLSLSIEFGPTFPTNPFRHRFHPDHDNLNGRFEPFRFCDGGAFNGRGCNVDEDCGPATTCEADLEVPVEVPSISRQIEFEFDNCDPMAPDALNACSGVLEGTYRETISGLHRNPINVEGRFVLNKPSGPPVIELNPDPGTL